MSANSWIRRSVDFLYEIDDVLVLECTTVTHVTPKSPGVVDFARSDVTEVAQWGWWDVQRAGQRALCSRTPANGSANRGPTGQRTNGPKDQRINGSTDQRITGSTDHRVNGSTDQRPNGSTPQRPNALTPRRISARLRKGRRASRTRCAVRSSGGDTEPAQSAPRARRTRAKRS